MNDFRRAAEAFRRAPQIILDRLDKDLQRAAGELARDMKDRAPKRTSVLTNSISYEQLGPLHWQAVASAGHSAPQEYGRQPGQKLPPVQAIVDWIRAAGITPNNEGTSELQLAWLIAQRIGNSGHAAQPYAEPAAQAIVPRLDDLVRAGLRQSIIEALA